MAEWKELINDSKIRWEENAEYWDDYMGEASNRYHRELIRPYTEELLKVEEGQIVLDIGCGNGNFSRRLAELGASVVAFDFSRKMIERAQIRSINYLHKIEFQVMDATEEKALLELGTERFDRAVANMALMDMAELKPLLNPLKNY